MILRRARETDFGAMLPIFQKVLAPGVSDVFAADIRYDDACTYWFASGVRSYVAENDGHIIGMYKLIANQRDLGSHFV
ncbi:hypothetical protein DBR37_08775 [Herminiimonas sp. KBW02]|uniref:hypothetical protein n=1 Tax=Herminiimonas sp. KBW02 TaxID=2153363 RepID=UPI000F5924D3|nr:hypothetical protein [Herminiimonas sp. KBW02]RQO36394.1 hypothetical protein DBR37_08775 [Herminiimonas sp. KBW02]